MTGRMSDNPADSLRRQLQNEGGMGSATVTYIWPILEAWEAKIRVEESAALLGALDTIDKAKALHQKQIVATWSSVFSEQCGECSQSWPCPTWQALGGNESGDDR